LQELGTLAEHQSASSQAKIGKELEQFKSANHFASSRGDFLTIAIKIPSNAPTPQRDSGACSDAGILHRMLGGQG
jgi:hypothetical protein